MSLRPETPQGVDWNFNTDLYLPRTHRASVFVPVSLLELRQINRRQELAAINVNLSSLLETPGGRLAEDEAQNIFTPQVLELRQNNPTKPKSDETADVEPSDVVEFPNAVKRAERSRLQRILPRAVAAVAGLAATLYPVIENGLVQAQNPSFPDPAPKKHLEAKGGLPSQQIFSSYTVEDFQLIGIDRLATLITLPDGQYIASGGLKDGELALAKKARVPFLGTAVFSSDDGTIMGALGSPAPGMFSGRLGLLENGSISVFNNGEGTITDGAVTPDKSGIIVRAGNTAVGETQYLYQYFDLRTKTFTRLNLCAGCVPGGVGSPLTIASANTVSSYGTGFPGGGYTESIFNTAALTASTTQWHPEQGYNRSKRLNHYYNSANEHIVWIVNNDTTDPAGTYQWATLFHNADNVHVAAKDVRPNIPIYPEVQAGQDISGIGILAAAADQTSGDGYMLTGFNPQGSVVYYPHVESFSLSNPNDLSKRLIVPEDGDLPISWPNVGMHGGPGRFVAVLNQGAERYLLKDLRVDQIDYRGLYLRRITNGITASDQWKRVTISGGYTLYLPLVTQQAN